MNVADLRMQVQAALEGAYSIEREVGRERFDRFLREYFDYFAFRSVTTDEFLEYVHRELPVQVPLEEWIYRPGIPAGAAEPHSDVFARIEAGWPRDTSGWSTQEWLHFLRTQEHPDMGRLEREFGLTESGNSELPHAELKCRTVQAQPYCCALWAREDPLGLLQSRKDLSSFNLFQSLALSA